MVEGDNAGSRSERLPQGEIDPSARGRDRAAAPAVGQSGDVANEGLCKADLADRRTDRDSRVHSVQEAEILSIAGQIVGESQERSLPFAKVFSLPLPEGCLGRGHRIGDHLAISYWHLAQRRSITGARDLHLLGACVDQIAGDKHPTERRFSHLVGRHLVRQFVPPSD